MIGDYCYSCYCCYSINILMMMVVMEMVMLLIILIDTILQSSARLLLPILSSHIVSQSDPENK